METTTIGYMGIIGYILGLYWDHGKENGNYDASRKANGVFIEAL